MSSRIRIIAAAPSHFRRQWILCRSNIPVPVSPPFHGTPSIQNDRRVPHLSASLQPFDGFRRMPASGARRGVHRLRTCHFQSPYLSPFLGQVTCISPNVYGPPVTLSLPFTPPGSPLPESCSCSFSPWEKQSEPIRTNPNQPAPTRPPRTGFVTPHPLHVTDRVTLKNASSLTVNANVTDVTPFPGRPVCRLPLTLTPL